MVKKRVFQSIPKSIVKSIPESIPKSIVLVLLKDTFLAQNKHIQNKISNWPKMLYGI